MRNFSEATIHLIQKLHQGEICSLFTALVTILSFEIILIVINISSRVSHSKKDTHDFWFR